MVVCIRCKKSIDVVAEAKQKFTRLGNDYFHSKCYVHIITNFSLTEFC